jgi:isopropylmalate/homocitrate/citramalate synthase
LKRPPADIAAGWRADSRPSDEQIAELLVKVKQKGTEKKGFLSDDEFKAILRETLK